jgi:hypothetical protein
MAVQRKRHSIIEETAFHLFFSRNFSKTSWQIIGIEWKGDFPRCTVSKNWKG